MFILFVQQNFLSPFFFLSIPPILMAFGQDRQGRSDLPQTQSRASVSVLVLRPVLLGVLPPGAPLFLELRLRGGFVQHKSS